MLKYSLSKMLERRRDILAKKKHRDLPLKSAELFLQESAQMFSSFSKGIVPTPKCRDILYKTKLRDLSCEKTLR